MRENCTSGTVRGVLGNLHSYRGNIEYARIKQVDIKVILPVHEEILAKQNIPPLQKNRRSLELLVL